MVPIRRLYLAKVFIAFILALSLLISPAFASQLSEKRAALKSVKSRIEVKRRELQAAQKRERDVLKEIDANDLVITKLNREIDAMEDDLNASVFERKRIERKLARTEKEIGITEADLIIAERKLAFKREIYNKRISGIYKHGSVSTVDVVLSARDLGDLINRVGFLEIVAKSDAKLVRSMQSSRDSIAERTRKLYAEKKVVNKQRLVLVDQENHIRKVRKRIAMREDLFRRELKRQERILTALEKEQKNLKYSEDMLESTSLMVASQIRILERGGSISVSRNARRVSGAGFMRPCSGRVTSRYGWRFHPILKRSRLHAGVDFGVGTGTPIYATNSGTVIMAGRMGGYGKAVVISHGGGITSLYAHNSKLVAHNGQYVNKGDLISYSGSTGLSTGPHLHFEIRVNGSPKNPFNWIK